MIWTWIWWRKCIILYPFRAFVISSISKMSPTLKYYFVDCDSLFCSFGFALALILTSNQESTHSPSDSVVNKRCLGFRKFWSLQNGRSCQKTEKMVAIHFEQVQRFILAKKIFWGCGHFKTWKYSLFSIYHTSE